MSERIKVVATGLGANFPGGIGVEASWQSLINGRSGISYLAPEEEYQHSIVKIAGQLPKVIPDSRINHKDVRRNHPITMLSANTAFETLENAVALNENNKVVWEDPYRVGVIIGSAVSGTTRIGTIRDIIRDKGEDRVGPYESLQILPERPEIFLCKLFGIKGWNFLPVSACATGTVSIALAGHLIRSGIQDAVLAGGIEMPIGWTPDGHIGMSMFTNLRALTRKFNNDPTKASCPFTTNADGFLMSEGSGYVLLESEESAIKRGVPILAELAGFAVTNDASDLDTEPNVEGSTMSMKLALADALLAPEEIDYLNSHATSTPLGDRAEVKAIHNAFGKNLSKLLVSSTKSITGHLLGAAGGFESIVCIKAIIEGIIPPTINHSSNNLIDYNLDFVSNIARIRQIQIAMSNSFGFGGGNATAIWRAYQLTRWI